MSCSRSGAPRRWPASSSVRRSADSMPSASTSTFSSRRVQVVLVPLHHAAVGHGGVLDRHQARELAARDHEAAGCCDRWRGKPISVCASQAIAAPRASPVQPAGAQRAQHFLLAVPPLVRARHRVDHAVVHAKRAAGVAQHAARSIRDDHRGQRGAVAAILVVDVLDHFLAALVLEVHVDVGRFVALLADEALEQRVAAYRVDLGDAQAVADGRVGGRAPALAQDALAARELDDVVDGQEIRLVLQVADQAQLFLDLRGDRLGHALREAARGAGLRLLAQVGGERVARRHDLVRILVAQLVQRSRSAAPPPASAPAPRAGTGWPAACACAGGARRCRPARSRSATPAGGCGCRPACRAAAGASAGASGPGPAPPAAARLPARPPRWRRGADPRGNGAAGSARPRRGAGTRAPASAPARRRGRRRRRTRASGWPGIRAGRAGARSRAADR